MFLKNNVITIRLSEEEKRDIAEFCLAHDISISQLCRRAAKLYMKANSKGDQNVQDIHKKTSEKAV